MREFRLNLRLAGQPSSGRALSSLNQQMRGYGWFDIFLISHDIQEAAAPEQV
jgi:hypothetical protein